VPDLPVDPNEILRALDRLRGTIGGTANIGDSLSRATDRAGDITTAINRLTNEVARMNANVERYGPVIESIEKQISRSMPVFDSVQGIGQAIRRTMGKPPGDQPPSDNQEP
jgi:hypothetical protein